MQGASLTGGQILWVFDADTGKFSQALVKAEGDVKRTMSTIDSETKKADESFNRLSKGGLRTISAAAIAAGVAIAKNLGNAAKRVDTLNNFPRVLSAMGVSANDAQAATQELSERLQGLPTALQDGASAVQNFIAAGLPVGAATEGFLALNNAFLAAGKDSYTASLSMVQLNKALARGKIEGQEWSSVTANMPTALTALQNQSGLTKEELRELYRESPEKLIADLIRLNTEGGGGLATLEEQARAATGGIVTAIQNLGNRITMGLGEIMSAFGVNDIALAINNFSTAIKDGLTSVARFIRENRQLIGTIGGAIAGFFAATAAIAVFTRVVGAAVAIGRAIRTAYVAVQTVMVTLQAASSLAAAGQLRLAGSLLVARAAAIRLVASLTIIGTAMAVIGFAAGKMMGKIDDVDIELDDASDSAAELAKWMETAQDNIGGSASEAGQLAKQLSNIAEQEARIRRDYRENLAQLVHDTRSSIRSLTDQLDEEERAYKNTYAQRLNDFNQTQSKEEESHYKKTQELQAQIDFLSRYDNETNQRRLSQLQFALTRENAAHKRQTDLRKEEFDLEAQAQRESYEKRQQEIQTRLTAEQDLLNKHRADVNSIRNVILLDEIEKLKRSRDEQLKSLREQRADATRENRLSGSQAADAFGRNFSNDMDKWLGNVEDKFGKSGRRAGRNFFDEIGDWAAQSGWIKRMQNNFQVNWERNGRSFWAPMKRSLENIVLSLGIGGKGGGRGWADGGFTGRGLASDPAGIVHKGEYVLKKSEVNQSTGMPKVDALMRLAGQQTTSQPSSTGDTYHVTVNGGVLTTKTQQRELANLVVTTIAQTNKAKGIA